MADIEKRLSSVANDPVSLPDGDEFLMRLHREIRRRAEIKRRLLMTTSGLALMGILSFGLFPNLDGGANVEWGTGTELHFLTGFEEEFVYTDSVQVDEEFVVEAVDYLVQRMDFVTEDWGIFEDLEALGIIDPSELYEWEESS
ncbi:MAG: hypothetical protein V3U24_09545 [Candidatus Neomarinimicrobiota bacterium]